MVLIALGLRPQAINTILGLVIFPWVLMLVRHLFQWSNLYLTLYQPMTANAIMVSHNPTRI